MRIRKRLQLNAVVSALTALVICLILLMALQRVDHAIETADIADKIVNSAFERSMLREDYLRTNSERAKEQWFAKQKQIGELLKSAAVVFRNSEEKNNVAHLIKVHETIGRLFAAIVGNRNNAGSHAESAALSREIEERLHTQLIMRLYETSLYTRKLQEAGSGLEYRALRQAAGGIAGVLAIVIASAFFSSRSMGRAITERIRRLGDGATVIGGGDLNHLIDIKGDDEFVELSDTFNAMTARLRGSYCELEKEIGERKLAEESLRQQEERLRLAMAAARMASWDWNITSDDVIWNDTHYRMMGYEPGEVQPSYHAWASRVHPEDREATQSVIRKCMAEKRLYTAEFRTLWPDGTIRWLEARGDFEYDAGNQPLRNYGVMLDITERKRSEEELRQAEEEWELTFNSVPDLIAIIDDRHRMVRVNKAMAEKIGRTPKECMGMACFELIHDSNLPPDFCPHSRTMDDGGEHNLEFHEERLGGDYLVTTTPLLDSQGRMTGTVHVARDITERKRAEEALQRAHDELEIRVVDRTEELAESVETLLEEMSVREKAEESLLRLNRLYTVMGETAQAIIRARNRDALFHDFCRIAVDYGGFILSWVGLLDMSSGELGIVAACGASGYLDDIHISVKEEPAGIGPTGISIREGTYYICNDFQNDPCTKPWHERGRAHGIKASASVAVKEEGWAIGALTLYAGEKDFFDRQQVDLLVQMGADISFALDNLAREARRQETETALQEETLERLKTVEALREKERMLVQQSRHAAMGEMIGNIAHQWRQPLNTLGLTIQQLLLFYDLGEFKRDHLEKGVASSMELIQHMSKTINDFRNYFSPDKEKVEFKAREAVLNTLSLLEGSFQNPLINIEIVAKDEPIIYGYQNEFAQVLLNILTNARDALIERVTAAPRVTITIAGGADCSVIYIADNAGGIPEEIIDKVFDPYFTTKGLQEGTGVGLFMSKTIIEKHMAGRLDVRNGENGAEFRIEVRNGIQG